jgi:tRNA(Ile)-lysidine synthase
VSVADDANPIGDAEADRLFADLANERALVLAVSGGADSTALLYLLARWRKRHKPSPQLHAVTIDHGLRPRSRREASGVKRMAAQLGVVHRTMRWTGEKPATGLQEKARAERYRLLLAAAHKAGARCVITAHTLDDQAETVLMRLLRGSGPAGLCAMARATPLGDVTLLRPLMEIPKRRLVATLEQQGIGFADDPSNRDPRFTRARLRSLMPALAEEGLDAPRLAVLARRLRRSEAAIEAIVDAAADRLFPAGWPAGRPIALDAGALRVLPSEVRLRLIGRAIASTGDEGPIELRKLEDLVAALDPVMREPAPARFRRTLAGAMVTLGAGSVRVERAPPRSRPKAPGTPRGASKA